MDYPRWPRLISEDEFYQRSKRGRSLLCSFSFCVFASRENRNKNGCMWVYGGSLCLCVCNDNNPDLNEWQLTCTNAAYKCPQTFKDVWPTGALFDNMKVILCLIREQDSISLATNKHFQGLWEKGSLGWIRQSSGIRELAPLSSLVRHYLFLPSRLLRSHFCVDLHTTRRHKKSCVSEYFLPTSPHVPFHILFVLLTKPNPCMEFRKKLSKW